MKKLEAIVGRADLDEVKKGLTAAGVRSFVASEAMCVGESLSERRVYRGSTYAADVGGCFRLEVVVPDDRADAVLNVLTSAAERGPALDGAVLVFSVDQALSRTSDLPEGRGKVAGAPTKIADSPIRAPRAAESVHAAPAVGSLLVLLPEPNAV